MPFETVSRGVRGAVNTREVSRDEVIRLCTGSMRKPEDAPVILESNPGAQLDTIQPMLRVRFVRQLST